MDNKVILVGGFSEIIELCERCNKIITGIIDGQRSGSYMGCKILGNDENAAHLFKTYGDVPLILSPDMPEVRKKLYEYFSKIGYKFSGLISPKANISKSSRIGEGTVIQDGANVSSNAMLGNFVKLNTNSNVMHDTIIGDFSTVAPNAVVLGRVQAGELSYIGANSTILPGIVIGSETMIGAGSVVTKNVGSEKTVLGNPAKEKIN